MDISPFDMIPDEIMMKIFCHLPYTKILEIARVHSRWKRISTLNQLWKELYFKSWLEERAREFTRLYEGFVEARRPLVPLFDKNKDVLSIIKQTKRIEFEEKFVKVVDWKDLFFMKVMGVSNVSWQELSKKPAAYQEPPTVRWVGLVDEHFSSDEWLSGKRNELSISFGRWWESVYLELRVPIEPMNKYGDEIANLQRGDTVTVIAQIDEKYDSSRADLYSLLFGKRHKGKLVKLKSVKSGMLVPPSLLIAGIFLLFFPFMLLHFLWNSSVLFSRLKTGAFLYFQMPVLVYNTFSRTTNRWSIGQFVLFLLLFLLEYNHSLIGLWDHLGYLIVPFHVWFCLFRKTYGGLPLPSRLPFVIFASTILAGFFLDMAMVGLPKGNYHWPTDFSLLDTALSIGFLWCVLERRPDLSWFVLALIKREVVVFVGFVLVAASEFEINIEIYKHLASSFLSLLFQTIT